VPSELKAVTERVGTLPFVASFAKSLTRSEWALGLFLLCVICNSLACSALMLDYVIRAAHKRCGKAVRQRVKSVVNFCRDAFIALCYLPIAPALWARRRLSAWSCEPTLAPFIPIQITRGGIVKEMANPHSQWVEAALPKHMCVLRDLAHNPRSLISLVRLPNGTLALVTTVHSLKQAMLQSGKFCMSRGGLCSPPIKPEYLCTVPIADQAFLKFNNDLGAALGLRAVAISEFAVGAPVTLYSFPRVDKGEFLMSKSMAGTKHGLFLEYGASTREGSCGGVIMQGNRAVGIHIAGSVTESGDVVNIGSLFVQARFPSSAALRESSMSSYDSQGDRMSRVSSMDQYDGELRVFNYRDGEVESERVIKINGREYTSEQLEFELQVDPNVRDQYLEAERVDRLARSLDESEVEMTAYGWQVRSFMKEALPGFQTEPLAPGVLAQPGALALVEGLLAKPTKLIPEIKQEEALLLVVRESLELRKSLVFVANQMAKDRELYVHMYDLCKAVDKQLLPESKKRKQETEREEVASVCNTETAKQQPEPPLVAKAKTVVKEAVAESVLEPPTPPPISLFRVDVPMAPLRTSSVLPSQGGKKGKKKKGQTTTSG